MTTKPEHEIRRPGWKSSEFWMAAVAMAPIVLPAILPMFEQYAARLPPSSPYAPLAAAAIAIGYAIARALVKKSRNEASAMVSAPPQTVSAGGDVNMSAAPTPQAPDASSGISPGIPESMVEEPPVFSDPIPRGEVIDSE
jgi:hypothetical protein